MIHMMIRDVSREGLFINERDGIFTDLEELETAPLCGGTLGNYMMLPGMDKIKDTDGDGRINGDDAAAYFLVRRRN